MRLISKAWEGYRRHVLPSDAPEVQVTECRQAFYAGASVLFQSLLGTLDPGLEPTDADMVRMESIDKELREFGQELDRKVLTD